MKSADCVHLDDGDAPTDSAMPAEVRVLADQLVSIFYEDLRRLAKSERRRVGAGVTMQTTALVNEAYLKICRTQTWSSDTHFLRAAALAMRHALVDHAIRRSAVKRGGGSVAVDLDQGLDVTSEGDANVIAVDEALDRLARQSTRLAQVVECRYFAGYSDAEVARALGISLRTVQRDWLLARAWLYRELAVSSR